MSENATARPKIVVGVDGSAGSKDALRWAARIAGATGATIEAVAVWNDPTTYGWSALPPLYPPHPAIEKVLNETVDAVFGAQRPQDMMLRVLEGSPSPTLIAASRDAQMLVVGSRGLGGITGLLLGSVSAQVAEHASCAVLVVHDGSAAHARAE